MGRDRPSWTKGMFPRVLTPSSCQIWCGLEKLPTIPRGCPLSVLATMGPWCSSLSQLTSQDQATEGTVGPGLPPSTG